MLVLGPARPKQNLSVLLLFLLSLYGFDIPLFQNSRMVGGGGFVSGFFV